MALRRPDWWVLPGAVHGRAPVGAWADPRVMGALPLRTSPRGAPGPGGVRAP